MLQSLKPAPKLLNVGDFVEFVETAKPRLEFAGCEAFILITEPNREETVARGLTARGYTPYAPVHYKRVGAGRRKTREVPRPLFPCYSFLMLPRWCVDQVANRIKAIPGVADFMMTGPPADRRYAILPAAAVDAIKAREAEIEGLRKGRLLRSANGGVFEIGQQVAVPIKTAFTALAGKITSVEGKNVSVLLEMEFLGRDKVVVEDLTLMGAGSS